MELSKKQKEIVETEEKKVVVNCAAAAGKTKCLTERVRYLMKKYPDSTIVAITFTNMAAEEMKSRLGKITDKTFIGTIHSYCNYLLLSNGIITNKIISEEKFDDLFKIYEKNLKNTQEIDYLLLDEAQDISIIQFKFLLDDLLPKNWMIFADIRQSIYGFRQAFPEYIIKLSSMNDVKTYHLNENYRNGENILNYAAGIMLNNYVPYNYMDNSICCSNRKGLVCKSNLDYSWMVRTIKSHDDYKDWFILTRDNRQLDMIKRELEKRDIPCVSFRQGDLNKQELSDIMNSNTVKVLTIHSSKGLEAKNVMVYGMRFNSKDEVCCSYVAATRAMDRLYILKANKKKTKQTRIINWE